jgi:hypothetical protein
MTESRRLCFVLPPTGRFFDRETGEDFGIVLGDEHGVLEMGRGLAIGGDDGPAVGELSDLGAADPAGAWIWSGLDMALGFTRNYPPTRADFKGPCDRSLRDLASSL